MFLQKQGGGLFKNKYFLFSSCRSVNQSQICILYIFSEALKNGIHIADLYST